jgi:hypothetical protein
VQFCVEHEASAKCSTLDDLYGKIDQAAKYMCLEKIIEFKTQWTELEKSAKKGRACLATMATLAVLNNKQPVCKLMLALLIDLVFRCILHTSHANIGIVLQYVLESLML